MRCISVLVFVVVWQWYSGIGNSLAIAPPLDVVSSLWEGTISGEIPRAALGTAQALFVGYAFSVVIGLLVGGAIGVFRWARDTLEPLVQAAYSTPMALLIPFVGIHVGAAFRGRVFIVIIWCVFEIIMNTITGVREAPPIVIEMARSFGARRKDIYSKVILPAALPHVLIGLRLGMGKALRGAIAAEILLSVANLGQLLATAQSTFDIERLLAVILFVIMSGYILMRLLEYLEARALPWNEVEIPKDAVGRI